MKSEIDKRFNDLMAAGEQLLRSVPQDYLGSQDWVPDDRLQDYQRWLGSAANLLRVVDPPGGTFISDYERIIRDKQMEYGIPSRVFQRILGLLSAAHDEWQTGLLRRIEHVIVAGAFDDFLDHAAGYHKAGKKTESAILASAVLEDTIKRVVAKHRVKKSGASLDPIIDDLVKAQVLTPVKAKRVKGFAAVRNAAFHAKWSDFDIKDVGQMINGIRELIQELL